MFFIIGYKEHALAFKASPYGNGDVFQGGYTGLTVGIKPYIMFGEVEAVDAVLDTWADLVRIGKQVELGELIHKTGVSLLGPAVERANQKSITDGAPALYYYDKGTGKIFQTNLDTVEVYELVSEVDEDNSLIQQLKLAILDYDKETNRLRLTNHIAGFISHALNLPVDSEFMYTNFNTGEIYRMNPGEFTHAK